MKSMEDSSETVKVNSQRADMIVPRCSGVIVPKLNMEIPFEENDEYDIEVCFKTISDLIEAMNVFAVAESVSDLLKVKE